MADTRTLKTFKVCVYARAQTGGEPLWTCRGSGDEWQQYARIKLPGFDGHMSVSLQDFWLEALANRSATHTTQVCGYETIVKFGTTRQLQELLTVTGHLDFSQ